jgi:predicted O-linked N-acetylglucosamine transferase (SPINDLY family)
LARARTLLGQKLFAAAWDVVMTVPESAERCRLEVDILIARRGKNDLESAQQTIERWLRLQPASPEPWSRKFEIALSHHDRAAMDRALARLLRISPGHARTLYYQGLRAQFDDRITEALEHYAAASATQYPDNSPATRQVMAASKAIETAMGKHPGTSGQDWALALGQPAVVAALEATLDHWDVQQPHNNNAENLIVANAWYKLAIAKKYGIADAEKCEYYCNRALQLNPDHQAARSEYLFALNLDFNKSPERIYALHVAAGDWWATRFPERRQTFPNSKQENKALRVGYLSSDIRLHPVAYFILPVLQAHNAGQVLSHVYLTDPSRDEYTERAAQAAYQFRHVFDFNDQALAGLIEKDGIDILVDLNGASGRGQPSLLARRAAPIQMTWLGYPNTTGLPTVDYRIVDVNTDPPPSAQAFNREKLLYLPRLFSVYDPLGDLPPVVAPPCLQKGHVTFGSFNNIAKINPPMLQCWARILRQVPTARLMLKYPTLDLEPCASSCWEHLETEGIRCVESRFPGQHQGRRQPANPMPWLISSLTPFYHGTHNQLRKPAHGRARGRRLASTTARVGVSLLKSAGRAEWIAHDEDEYVDLAKRLAHDPVALAETRALLRDQVQASALMDAPGFTRELEQAYRDCWVRWCRLEGTDNP